MNARTQIQMVSKGYGKIAPPAVVMQNPKSARNMAGAIRTATAFGIDTIVFTGGRVGLDVGQAKRLPREERMRVYSRVQVLNTDYPFDLFPEGTPIVGVELVPSAVPMPDFQHPDEAVYLFGPEDGSIDQANRRFCHHIVYIPSLVCFNLVTAIAITLADRQTQLYHRGIIDLPNLADQRGFIEPDLFDSRGERTDSMELG